MIPRFIFLAVIILSGSSALDAQILQPNRFEKDIKSEESGFMVISLKKEGLALIREDEEEHRKKKWQLEFIDSTLTKFWSTELLLDSKMEIVGYDYNQGHVHVLFRDGPEHYLPNYRLVNIDFILKETETHEIKFEVDFKMSHFSMTGNSAVFGGYVSGEPAVLLYDKENTRPKVLPGLFIRQMRLLDLRANQNQSFNVLLIENDKESSSLIVRTFDTSGGLILEDKIKVDARYHIQSGLTSMLERDELMIVGTYSVGKVQQSSGLFSFIVDPFSDEELNFIDFGSMAHFLDYLPAKRAMKIKSKAKRLREKGEIPSFSTSVMPYRIEERKDGFYLLAEVYHSSSLTNNPYWNNNNYYYPSMYGYYGYGFNNMNPYNNSRYYNSPYSAYNSPAASDVNMIESVVVKIGSNGRFEKDASIKFSNIKNINLEQIGDFVIRRDSIMQLYKKDNEIFYQSELGDSIDRKKSPLKIEVKSEHKYSRNPVDDEGTTRHWYDNHFYVWGYQVVKETDKLIDKTRRVFYVNRISLQ